jgi:hypothetical protein
MFKWCVARHDRCDPAAASREGDVLVSGVIVHASSGCAESPAARAKSWEVS